MILQPVDPDELLNWEGDDGFWIYALEMDEVHKPSKAIGRLPSPLRKMERRSHIKLMVPSLPSADEILPWLKKIDKNQQYTNFGPLCQELERELAGIAGAHHVVSVSSCTLGLELALDALKIAPGGQVLLPALTFPATASAVIRSGLTPLLGDVDEQTLTLTPEIAFRAVAENTIDLVLTVALHGHAHDPAAWDAFSAETGVPVLIDAAGAAGHQTIGSTTSAVFSLHATKPLAVGEGGFVATARSEFAGRIRAQSNFGFKSGEVRYRGTNAKLSEYHAAVGLAALNGWPNRMARRQALYKVYVDALDRPELRSAVSLATHSSASPNLCVRLHNGIDRCIALLAECGIETRRWYWPPLHRHSAFADCPRVGDLTITTRLSDQLLGLPFHLDLQIEDIIRISDTLMKIIR
jgi:dTDP-4-amino-4,6-dideoxygalactose transaminase